MKGEGRVIHRNERGCNKSDFWGYRLRKAIEFLTTRCGGEMKQIC